MPPLTSTHEGKQGKRAVGRTDVRSIGHPAAVSDGEGGRRGRISTKGKEEEDEEKKDERGVALFGRLVTATERAYAPGNSNWGYSSERRRRKRNRRTMFRV